MTMKTTYIPDLLVRNVDGTQFPVEAWVCGALDRAMFAVTKQPTAKLYDVTHVSSGIRMPGVYRNRQKALKAAQALTALLESDDWWQSARMSPPAATEWSQRNPGKMEQVKATIRKYGSLHTQPG
jgi:hypothetical protein